MYPKMYPRIHFWIHFYRIYFCPLTLTDCIQSNDKKIYNDCNEILSLKDYYFKNDRNKYSNKCKLCTNIKLKEKTDDIKLKNINILNEQNNVENIFKKCMKCKDLKLLKEFYTDIRRKNLFHSYCKLCKSKY